MKPTAKAIEAALAAHQEARRQAELSGQTTSQMWMQQVLTAAYAAQFQSGDYAGLVERLRSQNELYVEKCVGTHDVDENKIEPLCNEAADAIEAVLAERDELKGVIQSYQILLETQQGMFVAVQAERDALAARLAPVELIERDKDDPTREYIPLPGGWEIQTKGKGSSYRLLDKKTGERHMILTDDALFVQEFVTRMAKEINAAAAIRSGK